MNNQKSSRGAPSLRELLKVKEFSSSQDISKQLKEIEKKLSQIRTYHPFNQQLKIMEYLEVMKAVRQKVRPENTTSEFKGLMLEVGFPLPMSDIPHINVKGLIRIRKNNNIEYTRKVVERYMTFFVYNNELLSRINLKWQLSEELRNRKYILNQIIEGHKEGYYALTIPTMIAQLEGILVESMIKSDERLRGTRIGYPKQSQYAQVLLNDLDKFSFDEQIKEFFSETILASFNRGVEIESALSRHAILHGEDTNYYTKANSIKAILIFDYFFHKLSNV